jgi:murein DD-endopeptidase MepM/ murein hydrolase activator NlpD
LSVYSLRIFYALIYFLVFVTKSSFASEPDSISLSPRANAILSSLDEMSEPELILLMDSLIDADSQEAPLFAQINERINFIKSSLPKNQFEGFAFYPGHRFYGIWDTEHLFPYSDSLYKSDTLTQLDLSPMVSGDFYFPFNGPITSFYGWRDSAFHRGIDVDLNRGDSVRAAFSGMVRFAARSGGYGNIVIVRHYNGVETVYAHLWKIKVKPGDIVSSGQLVGLGGNTGHSTGTHLHFEIRFRGVAIDPAYFLDLKTRQLHAEKVNLVRTKQGYGVRAAGQEFHTVVRGDTLSKIAQRYGISIKQLRAFNNWEGYIRLKVGQQVRVQAVGI